MTLKDKLKGVKTKKVSSKPHEPVWEGPDGEGPNGGVTQSLLGDWLVCKERTRLLLVEGLRPTEAFSHRIEYGSMWHVCEEAYAQGVPWGQDLLNYASKLCAKFPLQQEQIVHWMNVCKVQFPIYVDYWAKHPDVKNRTPLLQEQAFDVPYILPSGRQVRLRGVWDSVDKVGKSIYLQENKTKGDIDEGALKKQLSFDIQTMIYLVALSEEYQPAGVRYNVVRRPLSGGKGSIRPHQSTKSNPAGESMEEFYQRLRGIISLEPDYFFMRWKVEVTPQDIARFCHEFLDPCLEQLWDWWGWVTSPVGSKDPFGDHVHFRMPYGVYSPLLDGKASEIDEYLISKSELGLERVTNLFREIPNA